jgi:hypothetical protein
LAGQSPVLSLYDSTKVIKNFAEKHVQKSPSQKKLFEKPLLANPLC